MKKIITSLALVTTFGLSACSGSSGSGSSIPSVNPSPVVVPTASPAPAGSALVTIIVPTRGPFSTATRVDPLTQIVLQINTLNDKNSIPQGVNPKSTFTLTPDQSCTSLAACSFTIPAPAGTLNITTTAYSQTRAVATTTQTLTSTGTASQVFSITLGGIVKSLNYSNPVLSSGLSLQQPLPFAAIDPSGAVINDQTFANAITLRDVDKTNATGLEIVGAGTGPLASVVLADPTTVVQFDYNGKNLATFELLYETATYQIAPL